MEARDLRHGKSGATIENPNLLAREELQPCTGACGVVKASSGT